MGEEGQPEGICRHWATSSSVVPHQSFREVSIFRETAVGSQPINFGQAFRYTRDRHRIGHRRSRHRRSARAADCPRDGGGRDQTGRGRRPRGRGSSAHGYRRRHRQHSGATPKCTWPQRRLPATRNWWHSLRRTARRTLRSRWSSRPTRPNWNAFTRGSANGPEAPAAGDVTRLDPAQARELFAVLASGLGAVHVSGGGRVEGRRPREALPAGASARGASMIEGHAELTSASVRAGGETPCGQDRRRRWAWSAELVAPLGVDLPVAPQCGQISHFELPGTDMSAWPVVPPMSSHYLLAFPGSRVVVGATRETGSASLAG